MNHPNFGDLSAWAENTKGILGNIMKVAEASRANLSDEEKSKFDALKKDSEKAFEDLKEVNEKLKNINIAL